MVLIHGMLTPWQIWQPMAEAFGDRYYVLVIELSGHTQACDSTFEGLEAEAANIEHAILDAAHDTVEVMCGLSLGGVLAQEIWMRKRIPVRKLVLDGAPLLPFPRMYKRIMTASYLQIVHKSKARDARTLAAFEAHFLPHRYLVPYLSFVDRLSDRSVENLVEAASSGRVRTDGDRQTRLLFLHGTAPNEWWSRRSAKRLKRLYPHATVICFRGDAHCYKAIYEPREWIARVSAWLEAM